MAHCLIITDDLTGAHATGVFSRKINYRPFTVTDTEHFEKNVQKNCDCIICPADSRTKDRKVAYKRIFATARMPETKEIHLYAKRIDSTLGGNLGSKMDALPDAPGAKYIVITVPCFPQSGRIVCGGRMLVNGAPPHKTEAATNPKTPANSRFVKDLFALQTKYSISTVNIHDLMRGTGHLSECIKRAKQKGSRIVVFDCITQEDLELIADTAILSKAPFVCINYGPFTAAIVRKQFIPKEQKLNQKVLDCRRKRKSCCADSAGRAVFTIKGAFRLHVCKKSYRKRKIRKQEIQRGISVFFDDICRNV